jgi:hypothetical protein
LRALDLGEQIQNRIPAIVRITTHQGPKFDLLYGMPTIPPLLSTQTFPTPAHSFSAIGDCVQHRRNRVHVPSEMERSTCVGVCMPTALRRKAVSRCATESAGQFAQFTEFWVG